MQILFIIIYLLGIASFTNMFYFAIQKNQIFDRLFSWQKMLRNWDIKGYYFLPKILGYCEFCFSHIFAIVGYVLFVSINLHIQNWTNDILLNIVSYIVLVSISTNLNLYFITKLFKIK